MIVESKEDKDKVMRKEGDLWEKWKVKVGEDLILEKRRIRWKMVEKARKERREGEWVIVINRRIWVEGKKWRWVEKQEGWKELEKNNREGEKTKRK